MDGRRPGARGRRGQDAPSRASATETFRPGSHLVPLASVAPSLVAYLRVFQRPTAPTTRNTRFGSQAAIIGGRVPLYPNVSPVCSRM